MLKQGRYTGFEVTLNDTGVAWIRFDRPAQMNSLTISVKRDLLEMLAQAQMDNRVRVLVFTGSGRAFCAGDDLKDYGSGEFEPPTEVPSIPKGHEDPLATYNALRLHSQQVNLKLRALDKLTIAAINGVAIQTGFSLALACDFRVMARSARVGSATLRFGLLPDEGGQYLLVQILGVARAMDFLMRKRIVAAEEALTLGLVHEVVDDTALTARADELALELATGPQVAMRLLKRSIYQAAELSFEHSCDEIAAKTAISDHHSDAREGVLAFREKRPARFS